MLRRYVSVLSKSTRDLSFAEETYPAVMEARVLLDRLRQELTKALRRDPGSLSMQDMDDLVEALLLAREKVQQERYRITGKRIAGVIAKAQSDTYQDLVAKLNVYPETRQSILSTLEKGEYYA